MQAAHKIIILLLPLFTIGQTVFDPANPCGSFAKNHVIDKKPIDYTYLREADVGWEKRVWRDIDLREKQNLKYYYPVEINPCTQSLFQVLTRAILFGEIIAFKDEDFMIPFEKFEIRTLLVKADSIPQYIVDEKGDEREVKVFVADSTSIYGRVLKFRLKEDWFFDKQKSVLEVRIVGLSAFEYIQEKEAYRELFWVYFPTCRNALARSLAFNGKNDNEYRSFDELFWKRDFGSVIIKESNVYDRYIAEYMKGIDALTESENIKTDLFNWEHDLWQY